MSIILSTIISFILSNSFILPVINETDANFKLSPTHQVTTIVSAVNIGNKEDEPLVITRSITESELKNRKVIRPDEILTYTNIERSKIGLKPLKWNVKLSNIADYKCNDMITKKYFAHVAPDGKDVAALAIIKNYDYSLIGENLAMGDFLSSSDVVDGWMQSKGHRANILKPTYTEIGVSVIPTLINGKISWYAVQEFGRPSPSCAKPDSKIESYIKNSNKLIESVNLVLANIKTQIDKEPSIEKQNKLIDSYNTLGNLAGSLHKKTTQTVSEYNNSINIYNNCIKIEDKTINTK